MESKDFSFGFAENISEFMIPIFSELAWMLEEWRQSSKLLEPGSFNVYKNVEVLDTSIETIGSDNCRGVSKADRDTNSMLAMIQEGARFSHKDEQKFIDPFIQLISRLCWTSQLYPRTKEQEKSSRVI